MKHTDRSTLLQALAAIVIILCAFAASAGRPRQHSEAERNARKADYIFLEAQRYRGNSSLDAYYSMIERAYSLNPTDPYLAMEYGYKEFYEAENDSAQMISGINRIGQYVDTHPENMYAAINYAAICSRVGLNARALATWENLYKANPDRPEIAGMYAQALSQTGHQSRLYQAIDIYNEIERTEGINGNLTGRKIAIYDALGDTTAVKRELHALIASAPDRPEYLAAAGSVYLEYGQQDSARILYDRAVEIDPTNGGARYHRAQFFEAIGDSAAYDAEIFRMLELPDLDMQPKMEVLVDYVSKLYTDSLRRPQIESMFGSLVSQYPHEAPVRNLYADYLTAIGNLAPAAEQVSYALDADPSDPRRWQMLLSLYFTLGDYDRALDAADKGLRFHPDNADICLAASSVKLQKKDYAGALTYIDHALSVTDPNDTDRLSNIYCAKADTYYSEGVADSAFIYYDRAVSYNPDNTLALNNFAYHLACQDKDLDRAISMIERAVKDQPESSTSLDTYAWVLFKMKNYSKAREIIDGALANDERPGEAAELLIHAGDIYFMDGHPEEALDFWKKALRLRPDDELLRRKVEHRTFFYQ